MRPPPPPGTGPRPIRVLVVEDSLTQRAAIGRLLAADGDIEVVAVAGSADEAVAAAAAATPDVVTVDLVIPGGGLDAIRRILAHRAVPVVVLSSVVGGATSLEAVRALAAGAVDAMPKPTRWDDAAGRQLRSRLRAVSGARIRLVPPAGPAATAATTVAGRRPIVGIGASTGGPQAVAAVLAGLTGLGAPICVVQHIHAEFTDGFAEWLGGATGVDVRVARHGAILLPGVAYVAAGGAHLRVAGSRAAVDPDPPTLHRPSVDVLLSSIAASCGALGVGVVLTGMGDDGAAGLLALRRAGGRTIAQDEATATIWGMPRAAAANGAAIDVLPLDQVAAAVRRAVAAAGRGRPRQAAP